MVEGRREREERIDKLMESLDFLKKRAERGLSYIPDFKAKKNVKKAYEEIKRYLEENKE